MSVPAAVAKGAARDARRRVKTPESESEAKSRYDALAEKIDAIADDVAAIKAATVTGGEG